MTFLAARFFACALIHSRGGNVPVGQVVGNPFVAPALIVQLENLLHDNRFGRLNLKCHCLAVRNNIAVGHGAIPFAVLLPSPNDVSHLLRGVSDRHFIHEEVDLNPQPIVIGRVVDVVSDSDNADSYVAQGFKLHQARAVSS